MPRKSSIRSLPPEIREQIGALLERHTLTEIIEHLQQLDVKVSRSALGRYKQHLDRVGEKLRRSREVAEALIQKLGNAPESKALRLNVELMHGLLMDLALSANDEGEAGEGEEKAKGVVLDAQDAMWLAKALDHLSRASKSDADLIAKLREQARKEVEAEMTSRLDDAARAQGMPEDQVRFWREKFLGVR
ncbi:MAG: phage protein Gp27 family protein [Humidesulfovibrio sp.]